MNTINNKNTETDFQESLNQYEYELENNMFALEDWKSNQTGFHIKQSLSKTKEFFRERQVALIVLGLFTATATYSFLVG